MKNILIGFLLFGLLLLVGLGGALYAAFNTQTTIDPKSVLTIEFKGELVEHEPSPLSQLFGGEAPTSLVGVLTSIRRAGDDPRISGILLNVISPKLGLAQIQEIEAAMKDFRRSEKWSLSFLETAGSQSRGNGAYALAVTADDVVLAPPGAINLIGLRAEVPFLGQLLRRLKLVPHVEKRKEYKNAPNSLTHEKLTGPHRESLKALLDDLQTQLQQHLSARREITADTAEEWIRTGPHSSKAALQKGLVDTVAYYDHVLGELEKRTGRPHSQVTLAHYQNSALPKPGEKTIGVITAAGKIHRGESDTSPMALTTTVGSTTFQRAFRAARRDEVSGILFRVNSPGGSYVASDLIRREVELCREAGIPVVVTMGNVAGSGGYFIAMDADYIVASPATITGSIGVYGGGVATRAFLQHFFGVTFDSYQTTDNASSFGWLDPPAGAQRAQITNAMDEIYTDFVTKVATAREKSLEEAESFSKGRIWSGEDALRLGLIDELGGYYTALEHLKKKSGITEQSGVEYQTYPAPDNPMTTLGRTLATGMQFGAHLGAWMQATLRSITTTDGAQLQAPELHLDQDLVH